MKKYLIILFSIFICLGLFPAYSQPGPGGPPSGPNLSGPINKLFGSNKVFSATLEMQTKDDSSNTIVLPGKISSDTGKTRFEVNVSDVKGGKMPPNAAAQMKSMGLDQMIAVSLPDSKTAYLIYPGLQSYVEMKIPEAESTTATNDYKMNTTEIGKETVDGHSCVKNKIIVTGKDGAKHEFTVWSATDLKNFPVKIQTTEQGRDAIMLFKNISLATPAASQFELPSGYKKYDSVPAMMQEEMMKHMGGNMGLPPH